METLDQFKQDLKDIIKKYYSDPIRFVEECFGVIPTAQQRAVLESLSSQKKVSVRAGHGVGKSALASWSIYWFLLTRPESKVICTAPTFHQLHDVLWAEAAKWRRKSELITQLFEWKQRRIECVLGPEDWWAAARTADKAEGLQGRHAGNFMLIVDEASGLDDEIFEATQGMLTSKNSYVLMLSNPTRNQGYFYDTFMNIKLQATWATHTLSCYDSIDDEGGLVSKTYIEDVANRYGEDSNVFRVRVLGEFPFDDKDSLIPHSWVMDATKREVTVRDEPLILGVDVGAGGDLSAIVPRKGAKVYDPITLNSKDTMEVVGWVNKVYKELDAYAICIDPIGIGKGGYDRLAELGIKNVFPVDVRRKSYKEGTKRLRDELWWTLREQFERGNISIPNDEDLIMELSSIKYKVESDSTIKIQSKTDMRRKHSAGGIGHSPDRADALSLTYYIEDELYTYEDEPDGWEGRGQTPTMNLDRGVAGY